MPAKSKPKRGSDSAAKVDNSKSASAWTSAPQSNKPSVKRKAPNTVSKESIPIETNIKPQVSPNPPKSPENLTKIVVFDERPETDKSLYRYLCCFCCCKYRSRKLVRAKEKERKRLEAETAAELLRNMKSPPVPQAVIDHQRELEIQQNKAALKIQAIIRGHLGRNRMKDKRAEVMDEVNNYWLEVKRLLDYAEWLKQQAIEARQAFVAQYVGDIFTTSVEFIIQNDACSLIQRTWRGHYARNHLPRRIPPKIIRPPRKKVIKSRFSPVTVRRVWARRVFEPEIGYYHNTDIGYLDYNMWEHVDSPPAGDAHGLRTYKIPVIPRSDRDKQILLNDKHAWVGLPVSFETADEVRTRVFAHRNVNVRRLTDKSPYNASVVNLPPPTSAVKKHGRGQQAQQSSIHQDGSDGGSDDDSSGGDDDDGDESGSDSDDDDSKMKQLKDKEYDSDDSRIRPPVSPPANPAVIQNTSTQAKSSQLQQQQQYSNSTTLHKRYTEAEAAKLLTYYGYIDETSNKLPALGTITYDPSTGRKIVHKGNNQWAFVHSSKDVNYAAGEKEHTIELKMYEKIQAQIQFENSVIEEARMFNNPGNTEHNVSLSQSKFISGSDFTGSLTQRSKIHHSKSGVISISNKDLRQNSAFLSQHKEDFLNQNSHHSLMHHNNIIDNRVATGLNFNNSLNAFDDVDNEFNFQLQPYQQTTQRTATRIGAVTKQSNDFNGSFLTEMVDQTDGVGVGAAQQGIFSKGFTANGSPIRGARKPRGKSAKSMKHKEKPIDPREPYVSLGEGYSFMDSLHAKQQRQDATNRISAHLESTLTDQLMSGATNVFDELSVWKNSEWGKLKASMLRQAKDSKLQQQIYDSIIHGTDIGKLDLSGRKSRFGGTHLENSDSDGEGAVFPRKYHSLYQNDDDSDEESYKKRNVYKPPKDIISKVVVWPTKRMKHYRLKYTWLPQPMLHNAVNNMYYDKSVLDLQTMKTMPQSTDTHYKTELARERQSYINGVNQSNMQSLVTTSHVYMDNIHITDGYNPSQFGSTFHDDASMLSNNTGSYTPQSTKHPLRQKEMQLLDLPKTRVNFINNSSTDSFSAASGVADGDGGSAAGGDRQAFASSANQSIAEMSSLTSLHGYSQNASVIDNEYDHLNSGISVFSTASNKYKLNNTAGQSGKKYQQHQTHEQQKSSSSHRRAKSMTQASGRRYGSGGVAGGIVAQGTNYETHHHHQQQQQQQHHLKGDWKILKQYNDMVTASSADVADLSVIDEGHSVLTNASQQLHQPLPTTTSPHSKKRGFVGRSINNNSNSSVYHPLPNEDSAFQSSQQQQLEHTNPIGDSGDKDKDNRKFKFKFNTKAVSFSGLSATRGVAIHPYEFR